MIQKLIDKNILTLHKTKAFILHKFPISLENAKKFGYRKQKGISLTVKVNIGNPDPKLPRRGRKAFYATKTRKINKLDIAIDRVKKKYPNYSFYKGYELHKNSRINISEIFAFN